MGSIPAIPDATPWRAAKPHLIHFFQARPLFPLRSVRADQGLSASCLLLLIHVRGTALHVPVQLSAALSRDRAKAPLFKLPGPTARAGPAAKILKIGDDDIQIIDFSFAFIDQ